MSNTEACCDLHGRNCEPPADLCCERCTEADHPLHGFLGPCSMTEARVIDLADVIGYWIGDQVYAPDDVVIVMRSGDAARAGGNA